MSKSFSLTSAWYTVYVTRCLEVAVDAGAFVGEAKLRVLYDSVGRTRETGAVAQSNGECSTWTLLKKEKREKLYFIMCSLPI